LSNLFFCADMVTAQNDKDEKIDDENSLSH